MVDFLILLLQIAIILTADVIVRDSQEQLVSESILDGKHAVIEQQAWEVFRLHDFTGREGFVKIRYDAAFLRNPADDALAVAV